MSGTKRTPIGRPSRHPLIFNEALALFVELEQTPRRQRDSQAFKNGDHELARLLGLIPEWWTTNSVLDRSKRPPWPPHLVAYADWHRCRAVREELLKMARKAAA
jgi:hypothetical protein